MGKWRTTTGSYTCLNWSQCVKSAQRQWCISKIIFSLLPSKGETTWVRRVFHAPSFQISTLSLTACQITFCQLKAWVRNFIFASWFSALPFLSSAVPCQLLLSSWTTCSSFQFQNLNSNLWTLPKWEWQDFTDVILWELCTNPFSKKFQVYGQISPHLFHHPLKQIFHFTVILRLCTSQPQKTLIFYLFVFQLVYWSSVSDCL